MKVIKLLNSPLFWTGIHMVGLCWMLGSMIAVVGIKYLFTTGLIFFLLSEFVMRRLAKKTKEAFEKAKEDV